MTHTDDMEQNPANPRRPSGRQPLPRRLRQSHAGMPGSRLIGYLILGVGILAVMGVLILALGRNNIVMDEREPDAKTAASLQQAMEMSPYTSGAGETANKEEQALVLPRVKSIRDAQVQGGWQSMIGDYVAVLQIEKGAFQIILAPVRPDFPRLYSSGTYRILDDIIVLTPRLDWKAPSGQGIVYERLTTGSYPMIAGFQDGAMVWQNVPAGEERIYVPPRSPLLLESGKNYIVWKKVD